MKVLAPSSLYRIKADETFVLLTSGSQARLHSYHISSPVLEALNAPESSKFATIRLELKHGQWIAQPDADAPVKIEVKDEKGKPLPSTSIHPAN